MSVRVSTILSGSSGNCTYIENGGSGILIDAGGSLRKIERALSSIDADISKLRGVFITHGHIDHVLGVKAIAKKNKIPIIANRGTLSEIWSRFPDIDSQLFVEQDTGSSAVAGDFEVTSFKTPHDSAESVGYIVCTGGKKIAVATDMGCVTKTVSDNLKGADIALIEANYDYDMLVGGTYPPKTINRILGNNGHLENGLCGQLALMLAKEGTKHIVLGHLSVNNNTEAAAMSRVRQELLNGGVSPDKDISLCVAPRYEMGRIYGF